MKLEDITFKLPGYGAGGTPGANFEMVIIDVKRSQRFPVTNGATIVFERAFGTTKFRIDTTFADGVFREGEKKVTIDLPEETDTPPDGSPFDQAELVSLRVILDDGTVIEGVAE